MGLGVFATIWKHMRENAFISATAFAALVHSTWTLGTMFSGMQPAITAHIGDALFLQQLAQSFAWHLPAFAIAFSLDVGQVVTSADLRRGERTAAKYATFFIFAAATFYLQMLYMVAHVPNVPLGEGVAPWLAAFVQSSVDHAVLVVPFLLPASTLLYTFSYGKNAPRSMQPMQDAPVQVHEHVHMHVERDAPARLAEVHVAPPAPKALPAKSRASAKGNESGEAYAMVQDAGDGTFIMQCTVCGATRGGYASHASAVKAASGHIGRYCKVRNAEKMQMKIMQDAEVQK